MENPYLLTFENGSFYLKELIAFSSSNTGAISISDTRNNAFQILKNLFMKSILLYKEDLIKYLEEDIEREFKYIEERIEELAEQKESTDNSRKVIEIDSELSTLEKMKIRLKNKYDSFLELIEMYS